MFPIQAESSTINNDEVIVQKLAEQKGYYFVPSLKNQVVNISPTRVSLLPSDWGLFCPYANLSIESSSLFPFTNKILKLSEISFIDAILSETVDTEGSKVFPSLDDSIKKARSLIDKIVNENKRYLLNLYTTQDDINSNSSIKPSLKLTYNDRVSIYSYLGVVGMDLLDKILVLVNYQRKDFNWPLSEVTIFRTHDPEINNREYVLVLFVFNSDFETADKYLHDFYRILDIAVKKLTEEENNILQGKIFFDIKTAISKD